MENQKKAEWYSKPSWTVSVLFETPHTREHAVRYCDELVERFWSEREFELGWLGFHEIPDRQKAGMAAERFSNSDLIVVAAEPGHEFPQQVIEWLRHCIGHRGQREGAVVGLLDPCSQPGCRESGRHNLLRRLSHAAGLDYLTEVPPTLREHLPDSPDFYSERAREMSGVMTSILERPTGRSSSLSE